MEIVIKGDKYTYYYDKEKRTVSDGTHTISACIKDIEKQDLGNVSINLDYLFEDYLKSLKWFEETCEADLRTGMKWGKLPD